MVTANNNMLNGVYTEPILIFCLSTDTKPTHVPNGSCAIEMDNSKIYFFDAENVEWRDWGAEDENTVVSAGEE